MFLMVHFSLLGFTPKMEEDFWLVSPTGPSSLISSESSELEAEIYKHSNTVFVNIVLGLQQFI